MAALVQTYPQQTTTVTMLQTRPHSSGALIPSNQGQTSQQYMGGLSQAPRSPYAAPPGYRGSSAPVQQYAFTSTPTLNQAQSWQPYGSYQAQNQRGHNANANHGSRPQHSSSMTNLVYNPAMGMGQSGSRDDSALLAARNKAPAPRPLSTHHASFTQQSFTAPTTTTNKAAPDRYRRTVNPQQTQQNQHGRSQSSHIPGNGAPSANQLYNGPNPQRSAIPNRPNSFYNVVPGSSADDLQINVQGDDGKRIRRRSMHSIDSADSSGRPNLKAGDVNIASRAGEKDSRTLRVVSNPTRNGSSESIGSSRSSNSRPSSVS